MLNKRSKMASDESLGIFETITFKIPNPDAEFWDTSPAENFVKMIKSSYKYVRRKIFVISDLSPMEVETVIWYSSQYTSVQRRIQGLAE